MSVDPNAPQPQPEPAPAQSQPTSFPVALVVVETGRSHGIAGGAQIDLIRDDQGNPETEYALVATIDGVNVPLQSYSKTVLDQLAASEKARSESQSQG